MRGAWWLLGLAGCMGPSEQTLIDELRLVAMRTDPAVVDPGAPLTLTVTVADPRGDGGDLLVWTCLEQGCATVLQPVSEQVLVPLGVPGPLPIWALACAPGLCGDLSEASEDRLRDPGAWLEDLPVSGVSAGFRTAPVRSAEADAEDPVNPVLVEAPASPVVAEERATLDFVAPEASVAYGYTTAGGFSAVSYPVARDGRVQLEWLAPAPPADETAPRPARIYVALEDGRGGVSVWIGDLQWGR